MKIEIVEEQGAAVAKGERIYLRELRHSDVTERYLSWFKDDSVTRFLVANHLSDEDVTQYMDYGRQTKSYFMYAICLCEQDLHIGNVKIGPIDWTNMRSDLVTVIGDTNYGGQGLGTEAISLGNRLAFDFYHIKELAGHISAAHTGSLKSYAKAGWAERKRIPSPDGHWASLAPELVCVSCFNPKYYSVQIADGKFQSVVLISSDRL